MFKKKNIDKKHFRKKESTNQQSVDSTNQTRVDSTNQTRVESTNQVSVDSTNQTRVESTNQTTTESTNQKRVKYSSDVVLGVAFPSSGTASSLIENDAFKTLDVDGEISSVVAEQEKLGLYQGLSNYKEYINKKPEKITVQNAGGLRTGPLRVASYLRASSRFDYAPDVCKDYKVSGFCGFGDSCKFLHDRSDYKTGWQLDQEWEEQQKKKEKELDPNRFFIDAENEIESEEHDSDDDLPFACLICQGEFTDPVVTKCKHYFCETCALKVYSKTPKCACCGANTSGVFNTAKNLIEKLKDKKRRMQEREEEIRRQNEALEEDQERSADEEDQSKSANEEDQSKSANEEDEKQSADEEDQEPSADADE